MYRFLRRLGAVLAAAVLLTGTLVAGVSTPAGAAGTYFTGAYVSIFGARDYHGYVQPAGPAGRRSARLHRE